MSDIVTIVEAAAEQLTEATSLRGYSYVREDVNPPCFVLALGEIERGAFTMGQLEFELFVTVLAPRSSDRAGQFKLYEYVNPTGSKSVWQAFEDADPLGLGDTDIKVLRYRPLGVEEIAAYGYFGGTFTAAVLTAGA